MTEPLPPPSDFSKGSGAAAIGARLRRLSERIDRDAARLYQESGEAFEQRWYGVVQLLSRQDALSVGDLSAALGVSHASISQIRDGLAKAGLIAWEIDARNARLRRLRLTPKGRDLAARLAPLWAALNAAAIELNDEAANALAAIERLEAALAGTSLYDRVRARLD
ncbi:MarR family transcriptional regulator [Caulobacter radicis]|uniref:MarR family winged helix-turn-helix transcriptional regulator n=1 Tax=Caulobacter radicis TaxID=2172650 RepID=UPI000D58197A|nr:MarR family transcriptional regulator [Caulobacter radicis]PVM90242.1 MarR family transcriptional regulator [Caulobacter radicis]